jgi:hypothetical protein
MRSVGACDNATIAEIGRVQGDVLTNGQPKDLGECICVRRYDLVGVGVEKIKDVSKSVESDTAIRVPDTANEVVIDRIDGTSVLPGSAGPKARCQQRAISIYCCLRFPVSASTQ